MPLFNVKFHMSQDPGEYVAPGQFDGDSNVVAPGPFSAALVAGLIDRPVRYGWLRGFRPAEVVVASRESDDVWHDSDNRPTPEPFLRHTVTERSVHLTVKERFQLGNALWSHGKLPAASLILGQGGRLVVAEDQYGGVTVKVWS